MVWSDVEMELVATGREDLADWVHDRVEEMENRNGRVSVLDPLVMLEQIDQHIGSMSGFSLVSKEDIEAVLLALVQMGLVPNV